MRTVLLIDADSTIPNIALMKLSTYHKSVGDKVELIRCKLPYYPNRKKREIFIDNGYDVKYCSVIYDGNKDYIVGKDIIFGGTGHSLSKTLDENIEKLQCDYSIYQDSKCSYGFITRGCIRKCYFCVVPEKEGSIRKVNDISNICVHKQVKFLDNNILSYKGHIDILNELVESKIRCQFIQGMDIRLLTKANSLLLSKLNYMGEYIFAFDSWNDLKIIKRKLLLLKWAKKFTLKFYVYVHPDMPISDTVNRIKWLRENEMLPYVMRDISCWKNENSNFFIDIASYCNQPSFFKKITFSVFLKKRYKNTERISESLSAWDGEYGD